MRLSRYRTIAPAVAIVILLCWRIDASLAPPPPPPQGWEQEVVPGFQPSIESVILGNYHCHVDDKPLSEAMKAWGPAAVPVIIKLYNDSRWKSYRHVGLRLLAFSDTPEARQFHRERLKAFFEKAEPSGEDQDELAVLLGEPVSVLAGPEAIADCLERLTLLSAKTELAERERPLVRCIAHFLVLRFPQEASAAVEKCAQEGNEACREDCICALPSARAVQLATVLLAQTSDEKLKKRLSQSIMRRKTYARAQEPMAIIIEKERTGSLDTAHGAEVCTGSTEGGSAAVQVDRSTARKLAKTISTKLDAIPCTTQEGLDVSAELALKAREMNLKSTVPALERFYKRYTNDAMSGLQPFSETQNLVAALAALAGDKAIPLFAKVAGDTSKTCGMRRGALMGLGLVASEKSAEAYKNLRDAAYAKPGAPLRKESYTHVERMIEAVNMTLFVIPCVDVSCVEEGRYLDRATVSEDYRTGHVSGGTYAKPVDYEFRRVGDEWLLVKVTLGPCL